MVAPTGARRTAKDHPALPITLPEIVIDAKACFKAGADGLHLHVRDESGKHTLDPGLYQEALDELSTAVPGMAVQITTEAVGIYSPSEQRAVVNALKPSLVSVSIAEMTADPDHGSIDAFYRECAEDSVAVQHILYSPDDVSTLMEVVRRANLTQEGIQMIFVLGRYTKNQQSDPDSLQVFLERLDELGVSRDEVDWGICAFGQNETACLEAAWRLGGKMRVGFENSLWHADGTVAANNAERVQEIVERCGL